MKGGKRLTGAAYDKGFFLEPTVFDEVDNQCGSRRRRSSGRCWWSLTFDDLEEALAIANDTTYGLAAGVWSRDLRTVMRFARGVKAGTVWVNCYHSCGHRQHAVRRLQAERHSAASRAKRAWRMFLETKAVHINHG